MEGEDGESGSTNVSESDKMEALDDVRRCEREVEKSFMESIGGVGVGSDSTKNKAQKIIPRKVHPAVTRHAAISFASWGHLRKRYGCILNSSTVPNTAGKRSYGCDSVPPNAFLISSTTRLCK